MLEGNGRGRLCHFGRTRHNFEWYGTNCGYTLYLVRTATSMNSVDCEGRERKKEGAGLWSRVVLLLFAITQCPFAVPSPIDTLNFRRFLIILSDVQIGTSSPLHWERCDYEAHFGSPPNATHDDIDNDDTRSPRRKYSVPPKSQRVARQSHTRF